MCTIYIYWSQIGPKHFAGQCMQGLNADESEHNNELTSPYTQSQ